MAENATKENKVLNMERTFDASRELVWDAWTKPEMLSKWWSPDTFSVPRCEIDVRPEGKIYIEMKGPDGAIYPMTGEYKEIVKPEKLVFVSHVIDGEGKEVFSVHHTIIFTEENGKTTLKLTWEIISQTPEAEMYLSGMNEGLTQSLEKLKALF